MRHLFVKTLRKTKAKGNLQFPEGIKILEEQADNIRCHIEEYQNKRDDVLKEFAIDSLNEIVTEEKEIQKIYDQSYSKQQEIQLRMSKVRAMNDVDLYKYWLGQSEYYGEVLNHISDTKFYLVEFLAANYPLKFAIDEKKFELMKSILPAWNPARKKVISLSKVKKLNAEVSRKGGKASKRPPETDTIQKVKDLLKVEPLKKITGGTLFNLVTKRQIKNEKDEPVKKDWLNKHLKKFKEK